jgi:tRNA(fMet)-specific endonuclease VapC
MPYSHLLDTNVISRLMKEPSGVSATRLTELGDGRICTSTVVACELRFGAALRGSKRLAHAVERVLGAIPVLPLEQPADEHYATIRHDLQTQGTPIGPNDLLIAAHARSLGFTLVTENEAEFCRVRDLTVENWQTQAP